MGTTAKTTAGAGVRVRVLLAACALALLVSVGAATTAGAERPTGNDSHAIGCRLIYDDAKRLRDEYLQVALTNPNSPRLDEIIAEGRNLGSDWIAAGCKERFGSIAHLVVRPVGPAVDPGDINTADPGQAANPGEVFTAYPGQVLTADPGQAAEIIEVGDEPSEVATADGLVPVEDEQP